MRVLVTGGTGYVGAHSTAALLTAGYAVRMLVREPDRVDATLAALGIDSRQVELVAGDVTDAVTVARAVDGCAAVLHAAGVYSFHPRDRRRMAAVNVDGTELVLRLARSAGLDPIVHVSTFGALLPAWSAPLSPESPVGSAREPYLASKAAADRIARRHQRDGAPVVITYPLACLGPYDPHLGDQLRRVRDTLRGRLPLWPTGGFPVGDVRDVARLHVAVLQPGHGPRRLLAPGRYVRTDEFVASLRRVTGRTLPALRLPAAGLEPAGRLVTAVQRWVPAHLPVQYGAIHLCRLARPVDNTATRELLGDRGRDLDETMADSVRWLAITGRLSARQAGRVAVDNG